MDGGVSDEWERELSGHRTRNRERGAKVVFRVSLEELRIRDPFAESPKAKYFITGSGSNFVYYISGEQILGLELRLRNLGLFSVVIWTDATVVWNLVIY